MFLTDSKGDTELQSSAFPGYGYFKVRGQFALLQNTCTLYCDDLILICPLFFQKVCHYIDCVVSPQAKETLVFLGGNLLLSLSILFVAASGTKKN